METTLDLGNNIGILSDKVLEFSSKFDDTVTENDFLSTFKSYGNTLIGIGILPDTTARVPNTAFKRLMCDIDGNKPKKSKDKSYKVVETVPEGEPLKKLEAYSIDFIKKLCTQYKIKPGKKTIKEFSNGIKECAKETHTEDKKSLINRFMQLVKKYSTNKLFLGILYGVGTVIGKAIATSLIG